MGNKISISELSEILNVSVHTLRYYEKEGLEVVRKSRQIGNQDDIQEVEREELILEPIESVQGSFQSTARSVYELLSGTAETYPIADEGTFYLTRLSDETFFCMRVTDRSTRSLCFEKGAYLCYRFKGNLSLDGIPDAMKKMMEYATQKGYQLIGNPLIEIVDLVSLSDADVYNEIISVSMKIKC